MAEWSRQQMVRPSHTPVQRARGQESLESLGVWEETCFLVDHTALSSLCGA